MGRLDLLLGSASLGPLNMCFQGIVRYVLDLIDLRLYHHT